MTAYYAHSTETPDKSDWQRLSDHLQSVGGLAATNAKAFGAEAMASVAGLLHDLGKYTERFQARLSGDLNRVDHATWGAAIARDRYKDIGQLLAYGIAGHHAGLANGVNGDARSALKERLSPEYLAGLPALLDIWQQEIALPDTLGLPAGFNRKAQRGMFQLSLLARMVFSCLVDADFIDTDNYYRQIKGDAPRAIGQGPKLEALRERLNTYLLQSRFEPTTDVKRLRGDILHHVRSQAQHAPGRFSLTVPTGGGKTLSSLAFALDHAIHHGLRRIIYVIPFTSIIEQNAQVFRDAFGDLGEDAVLEHHSAFIEKAPPKDDPDRYQSTRKLRLAMENWDAPVVVTTAVQFFESLFSDRPSRCRKLHNIAGSVVILDEAQTLPQDLLRPCVTLLDELALNYCSSIVLCTATQPALRADEGFKGGLEKVHELAPEPDQLYRKLKRVSARHIGTISDDRLADQLRQREQVLCIVNNRRHARQLFESIQHDDGARHLSTLMTARHRSAVLAEVRQRLKEGSPCRLISTSLIEAGVDISLPAVLRAEAGLDSIAQAAGRCNREGLWPVETSEVLIFATENPDWAPPTELKLFAAAFRSVERRFREDLLALEAVKAYFQELYFLLGDDRLDKEGVLDQLKRAQPDSLPLETLAANFRVIKTTMRPVIIPFDWRTRKRDPEVETALNELEFTVGAARKLQTHLVQVPQKAYDALWQTHAIEPIAPEKYGEQFVQLVNARLYDGRFGLHWDDPQFLDVDTLVV
ncbi:CRISPR-associated helicase/endonuclease Cas3 [Solimonas soli]|uniref:CRISPR-associated helicase/endonuclease Cas3 n=1 Tax=Solimonas soli TaxID=413479 RepID=UPI000482096F|nr:CRISPR-associated helicase/endonuclease Cas3 [Solimonas soli]